ncbi:MAG: MBL fold metallo-hydrolase [Anaerolineae bacterium]|jgi:glyoxylase-like metal-dependent hydrolase (beta-lactamase superfamily II)|nr:MBL fold metallo-hydrolase [Anaerolineae bacterium]
MQRERVSDHIYVFTSDLYAQVTASLVVTSEGAILIDTLSYPQETRQIKRFVEEKLKTHISYIINTHFHADHTTGTCLFDHVPVIGHRLCRELLDQRGRASLEAAQALSEDFQAISLVLPSIVFDSRYTLHFGGKTLQLWSTPGHSADSIVCYVEEDQVLFAADTILPVPYFVDGSYLDLVTSLRSLQNIEAECIVQGHGEVILRGEIDEKLQEDLDYLRLLSEAVDRALSKPSPDQALAQIDIEQCGKTRILLNGAVQQLHRYNVLALAEERRQR